MLPSEIRLGAEPRKSEDSENLYEDWLKSSPSVSLDRPSSSHTVVIKSVAQSYQELFENIYLSSDTSATELAKVPEITGILKSISSPKEITGSMLEYKDLSRTFYASILEQAHESDEEIEMYYCRQCKKNTYPVVSIGLKQMNLWNSFRFFLDSLGCCSSTAELQRYHEYSYLCSLCKGLLLRKPIIVT